MTIIYEERRAFAIRGAPETEELMLATHIRAPQPCYPLVLCRESPDQGAVLSFTVPGKGAGTQVEGGKGVPVQGARQLCSPAALSAGQVKRVRALLARDLRSASDLRSVGLRRESDARRVGNLFRTAAPGPFAARVESSLPPSQEQKRKIAQSTPFSKAHSGEDKARALV